MTKRIIVHIGSPKTGSTALQMFLSRNRDALRAHGFDYPQGGTLWPHSHRALAYSLRRKIFHGLGRGRRAAITRDVTDLRADIAGGHDTIILSSEWLYGANPKRVARWLAPMQAEIRPVLYIRDQVNYLTSYYQEMVGYMRITDTLDDYVKYARNLDLDRLLRGWEQVFGRDNITVRLYARDHLKDGDVISDFLALLDDGLAPRDFDAGGGRAENFGLGGDVLEFKRALNAILTGSKAENRALNDALKSLAAANDAYRVKPAFLPETAGRIEQKYRGGNQAVFERYFNASDHLFDYRVPKAARLEPLDGARFAAVLDALGEADKQIHGFVVSQLHDSLDAKGDRLFGKIKSFLSYL